MKKTQISNTEASLKLYVVISRTISALHQCASQHITRCGLIPADFGILECLLHKGELPISVIGSKVLLANTSMTAAIDRLEKRGLVRRSSVSIDRRTRLVDLTDEGRQLISSIFADHAAAIQKATDGLTLEEKMQVLPLLKKLGVHAESVAKKAQTTNKILMESK